MMTDDRPPTYSVPEAAARLGISKFTLYRAVNRGDIVAIKIGRCTQIPAHVVDELLAHGNNQAAAS